ncbi:hypothetical protein [Streptomyces sp. NPDC056240]|uniref:hypothetical protein n=1 Tax=Streptomyces sp. NPDC056240 TaxID=3345759 RepID=UPI0035D54682
MIKWQTRFRAFGALTRSPVTVVVISERHPKKSIWRQYRKLNEVCEVLVRGYVLFEVEAANSGDVRETLTHHSLGGCKVLASEMQPGEIITHLEADGFESFNTAVAELAALPDVLRATTLRIAMA